MKKLISLMLVLALGLLGCALAEAADVTGEWYLNVIESQGMQLDPALMGMELTIVLNADGSAELGANGEFQSGSSWVMAGGAVQITDPAGDVIAAVPEGASLVIDDAESGLVMILGREREALQGYVPASVEENPALQDFEGTWNAALIDMMGMQVSMETIGMKLHVEIQGESAHVTSNESGAEVTYDAPVSLAGNTLVIAAVDDQMPIYLKLQQDGKLVFTEESEGLAISMYFERIA